MVANFTTGGAAVNVLARHAGADVWSSSTSASPPRCSPSDRVASAAASGPGTADLAAGPAMTRIDALLALDVGAEMAGRAIAGGARCLITGDMGIGNTTPSAALIAAITGRDRRPRSPAGARAPTTWCWPARSR